MINKMRTGIRPLLKLLCFMIVSVAVILGSGCNDVIYYDQEGQSVLIIDRVAARPGMRKQTSYRINLRDSSGLGSTRFWFIDDIGKFNVGDTLVLIKKSDKAP